MKRIFSVTLIILTIFLFSLNAHALTADGFEGKDLYLYYGTTADNITIGWDAGDGFNADTDTYEIVIHNPERNMDASMVEGLSENTLIIQCPKVGHWIVKVRTQRVLEDGTIEYSVWAESTDPKYAKVNGEPRGWWIFTWLASTGPIITNNNKILMDNH